MNNMSREMLNIKLKDPNLILICCKCRLEVTPKNIEALDLFQKNGLKPNQKTAYCNSCKNESKWLRRNPDKTSIDYLKFKEVKLNKEQLGLRVCNRCGVVAKEEKDLENFVKDKAKKYGRANQCLKCRNKLERESFKHNEELLLKKRISSMKYYTSELGKLKSRVQNHKRRKSIRHSTPNWVSKQELHKIDSLYKQAFYLSKLSNIKYHIDHIYPTLHPLMCGLNIYANLQLLEEDINMKKNNYFGYLWQTNLTELARCIKTNSSSKKLFKKLGSKLSWDEFIKYEKQHYKDSLYENK